MSQDGILTQKWKLSNSFTLFCNGERIGIASLLDISVTGNSYSGSFTLEGDLPLSRDNLWLSFDKELELLGANVQKFGKERGWVYFFTAREVLVHGIRPTI